MDPFILTDDNIFDLFDLLNYDITWHTIVRIKKNCIGTRYKFIRSYCCTNVIKFITAFNASIIPVLEVQGVQDLKYCHIGLIYENNDPTNLFYPCEALYDIVINKFLKCWNHRSMTASELLRQRQQPTTHEDEDEDEDDWRRVWKEEVWNVGGRKRKRTRRRAVAVAFVNRAGEELNEAWNLFEYYNQIMFDHLPAAYRHILTVADQEGFLLYLVF